MMEQFAKLFDTPHGQLLVFLDETEDEQPAITIIGARVRGVRAKATMSGWPEGEEAQLRNFAKIDQAMAEDSAASLHRTADSLAPRDSRGRRHRPGTIIMTPSAETKTVAEYLREIDGGTDNACWVGCAKGDPGAVLFAPVEQAFEEAAKIADSFKGRAKRDRIAKGWKMARFQPHERDEIAAEENGENIAAADIAEALRQAAALAREGAK